MVYLVLTVMKSLVARLLTDYSRWRLLVTDGGRHTWHYLTADEQCAEWPQNTVDKFWLGLDTNLPKLPPAKDAYEAAKNGYTFYQNLQSHDGHWAGEYGGPLIGSYISGMGFKDEERLEMIRYIMNRAHPQDGGWGIHIEGHSTVFGTALNYVALRILGMEADHPVCIKSRATLHKLGGATAIPAWGKFWLSLLNVYDWEGNNPVPPEFWLLPEWLPIHPSKWWIHTRAVYLPMSYLYGVRFTAPENHFILSLRQELYTQDYYSIHWPSQRNNVSEADLYSPHSAIFDMINVVLAGYEQCTIPPLRAAGIKRAYQLIVYDDENTGYQTLAPVSKMFALVARYHAEGPDAECYRLHMKRRADFMWMGAEGMMVCGTNGSQLWDTGFIAQALVETGLAEQEKEFRGGLTKALEWLDQAQIRENPRHFECAYRHASKGAWGFSTTEQGYTVSDCTGEGLKAVMYLQYNLDFTPKLVDERRMCDAVDIMLSLQNPLIRAPQWLELLNPAEVFGNIMVEYTYPECTTSVITALSIFRKHIPYYRRADIDRTIKSAIKYLHDAQHPGGGWVGSWGICFTYATQLHSNRSHCPHSKKACDFLLSKQREDGGWGESYKSCEQSRWIEHEKSQIVQTCWAVMSLIYDGSWPQEAIEGVFNKTCAISYPNFKFSFPIWMLGKAHIYLKTLKEKATMNGYSNRKAQ
ncbi:terpenoid cyclases/protein prenyltransferase alpha-alpha toroid [Cyathus striatus]|nr:terpenoid cyclases/protein prenyltransferase alpha-alpha toroid [Cyathus striatus]